MKIASPGSFSTTKPEDNGEQAAQLFLQQKDCGNIDKAREVGERLALLLLEKSPALFPEAGSARIRHHRWLLFSYAANRVIADNSPNSIIVQAALNVYYNALEEQSPEMYDHVNDDAAFSLYILCERSNTHSSDEIGKIYAELCNCQGDVEMAGEGNRLYKLYYDSCARIQQQYPYVTD